VHHNYTRPELATEFFALMAMYNLAEYSVLIAVQDLDNLVSSRQTSMEWLARRPAAQIHAADALWNFAASIRQPLLGRFTRRVLIDGDPGHLQVCALTSISTFKTTRCC
jgi:hypothetical protein